MGSLLGKKIVQSRVFVNPDEMPIPDVDYYLTYPESVFTAIKKTMSDESSNLQDEFDVVDYKLSLKQDLIPADNIPGTIITYTETKGELGRRLVIDNIQVDPSLRSRSSIPNEKAVGTSLDTKAPLDLFNIHINNKDIHITPEERTKWDDTVSSSDFDIHINDKNIHITSDERISWNNKADQTDLLSHVNNYNNPHKVTADQVGTYDKSTIDDKITEMQTRFFHWMNIVWDDRANIATLVDYNADNWDPNYILPYGSRLPDVQDPNSTYFAVIPATDYLSNETNDVIIFIKRPTLIWTEVGRQTLRHGDLLIRYPDTAMFLWVAGHFVEIITRDSSGGGSGGIVAHDNTLYGEGSVNFPLGLADNAVTTNKLSDGSVNTPKIINKSVTSEKLADKSITLNTLSDEVLAILGNGGGIIFPTIIHDSTLIGSGTTDRPLAVNDLGISTGKIAEKAVTANKIADGAITIDSLSPEVINYITNGGGGSTPATVGTNDIYDFAITLNKLANNSVDSSKIIDGSINTIDLADGAVTSPKLATDSVSTIKIVDLNVTSSKIADGAITRDKLSQEVIEIIQGGGSSLEIIHDASLTGRGTITSPLSVTDLGIVTNKIANQAVTSNKLADLSVTPNHLSPETIALISSGLGDGSVGTDNIQNYAVTIDKIANNSINSSKIIDGSINTIDLADGSVTNPKLATNAVTEIKIANGAVSTNKLMDNSVTSSKLSDNAVITTKILNSAITDVKIANNAVTTVKILNSNVTNVKLSTMPGYTLKGNTYSTSSTPQDITFDAMIDTFIGRMTESQLQALASRITNYVDAESWYEFIVDNSGNLIFVYDDTNVPIS